MGVQLVALEEVLGYWVSDSERLNPAWIAIFFVVSILFNLLEVGYFAEIEFVLTVLKVLIIVGLICLGILLPLGVSVNTRNLGTIGDSAVHNLTAVPCALSTFACLQDPGLPCVSPFTTVSLWQIGAKVPSSPIFSAVGLVVSWLFGCVVVKRLSPILELRWSVWQHMKRMTPTKHFQPQFGGFRIVSSSIMWEQYLSLDLMSRRKM